MTTPTTPLRAPVFHILLALAREPLHGLGIAANVDDMTEGAVVLGPGTLYRSLKEMVRDGLIQEVPAPHEHDDPRRRYYGITSRGLEEVRSEATRLARIVDVARDGRVLPESGSA
jgi:DNA-binding PadR family transcriptional regulator